MNENIKQNDSLIQNINENVQENIDKNNLNNENVDRNVDNLEQKLQNEKLTDDDKKCCENNEKICDKTHKMSEKTKETLWQSLKFLLFSISAGVIQIVSFTVLSLWVFKDTENLFGWSHFIALMLSVVWNFTFNRKFTFKSANNVALAMLKVALFYVAFTPLSIFGGQALVNLGWNEFLVEVITMVVNFILEFLYCKFFVYREKTKTKEEI